MLAEIHQFALIRLSSSRHSEACNALGAPDGVTHSSVSVFRLGGDPAVCSHRVEQFAALRGL